MAAPAFAQVGPEDLGLDLFTVARAGKEQPAFLFRPQLNVAQVRIACSRGDGKKISVGSNGLRAGRETRIAIPQGKGVFRYDCVLSGKAGKEGFGPFQLDPIEVKVGEPPLIAVQPADVDETNRRVTVRLTEPAGHIEFDVFGDKGQVIDNVDRAFHGEPAGTPLTVTWSQKADEVMGRFALRAYDPAGFWSGIESVTFVDIPHEDVVFESGKWDIRPSEEAKLLAPLADIRSQLDKVKGVLAIDLYVGGYTDTVGSTADNAELSRKRAESIARWFRAKGVTTAIKFQGFGESVLFVATPDNTDEARNRRAAYVLASQAPPASRGFPAGHWAHVK